MDYLPEYCKVCKHVFVTNACSCYCAHESHGWTGKKSIISYYIRPAWCPLLTEEQKIAGNEYMALYTVPHYIEKIGKYTHWTLATRKEKPKCVTGEFEIPDAVVIVASHLATNTIVITKEFRVPLADYEYGFPAGLIDAEETIENAARRELFEETGLILTDFLKISPPIYSSPGITDESVSMVYCRCEGEPTNKHSKESEDIETLLMSINELYYLLQRRDIKFGAKAWIALNDIVCKERIL